MRRSLRRDPVFAAPGVLPPNEGRVLRDSSFLCRPSQGFVRRPPRALWAASLFLFLIGGMGFSASPGLAQAAAGGGAGAGALGATPLPDTYRDAGTQALVQRAQRARARIEDGLESYNGVLWERTYVGLDAIGFRRERGLLQEERTATIRWERDGVRTALWDGGRREIPIVGATSARQLGMARTLSRQLLNASVPPPLTFDPGSDRLVFGEGDWALHPLADTAWAHYRYASGDTLTLTLPIDGRSVVIAEVLVEPRRSDFRLLAASLWFDIESGSLVRAVYRPARPFDLSVDDPDGSSDVPWLLRPIRAEIRIVTVDHALQDFRWWIPRRFVFEGEGQVGLLARFPLSIEWTVGEILVNDPAPEALLPTGLRPGWIRQERRVGSLEDGGRYTVASIVPPFFALARGPNLTPPGAPDPAPFRPAELRELEGRVRRLLPTPPLTDAQFAWGLAEGMTRVNRIEGVSTGVALTVPRGGGREVRGEVRIGSAATTPVGRLDIRGGTTVDRWQTSVYRDLVPSADWGSPHGLTSSLSVLWDGGSPAPFHYASGIAAGRTLQVGGLRLNGSAFYEAHTTAIPGFDWRMRQWFEDALPVAFLNPLADEGNYYGFRANGRWQSGQSPLRARSLARGGVEGASGEQSYGRGWALATWLQPVDRRTDLAIEGGGGMGFGDLPAQRRFFPGGSEVYRPGKIGSVSGDAFTVVRGELARGIPAARIVVSADALWVRNPIEPFPIENSPWNRAGWSDAAYGVGVGASFLDGLIRVDLVREIRGASPGWRFLFYTDGLF